MPEVLKLRWLPTVSSGLPRSARRGCDYEAYVPDLLADRSFTLRAETAADIADAERAVERLNSEARGLADSEAIARLLLRAEAVASSRIEGLEIGARRLLKAQLAGLGDNPSDVTATDVLNNVNAMRWAVDTVSAADVITVEHVLGIHERLLAGTLLDRHAGQFREEQNWIGGSSYNPCSAAFVPPPPERVRELLEDLCAFCNDDALPPVAQAALAHAQFETIHPFVDGNGRTGRALAQAMLRSKGLVEHVTVPISAGLLTDTGTYFNALNAFRAGDAGPIVHRFADASRFAAASGRALVDDLAAQLTEARDKLAGVRPHAAAWRVLPRLVGQPIINARYLTSELAMNDVTAQRTLELLADRQVLVERTGLRRNRVWQHTGILDVLDNYASTIRRTAP
jgi:Fic family protein